MKKILLVEDDASLGETLYERLCQNYEVQWVRDVHSTLKLSDRLKEFNLIVLDVGLPDGNGFELAQQIRKLSQTPFLFLTAQADAENRLKGYQLGAEEFIPKPFHLKELLIRLDHVLRRHTFSEVVNVKNIEINFSDLSIINEKNEKVFLASSEMKVLEILIKQAPRVLDRDEILNQVWGLDRDVSHRSIDNIVVKIRSSLSSAGSCVHTVRGRGYQWISE